MGCVNGKPILGKEDLEFIATYTGEVFFEKFGKEFEILTKIF